MFSLTDVDIVLMRMTIIGVLLSFRALAQEALNDVSIIVPVHVPRDSFVGNHVVLWVTDRAVFCG